MSKFVVQRVEAVRGKIQFYTLNDCPVCPYDTFCKESKAEALRKYSCSLGLWDKFEATLPKKHPAFRKQLLQVYTQMDLVANLVTLPHTKFKDITPGNDPVKEYEIKTGDLRVYLFHLKNEGRIIVCGGIKGTQQSDIRHFRNLKKAFINQYFAR